MNPPKPLTLEEYEAWLRTEHKVESIEQHRTRYESVAGQMKETFGRLPFWAAISGGKLDAFDERYRFEHADYGLLTYTEPPMLLTKSFDSFLEKTYRINALHNRRWPGPPRWLGEQRWILPYNWFNAINDIVRTCFIVKYFDGVKFLLARLEAECKGMGLPCHSVLQAREEGHYAAHLYVTYEINIISTDLIPEIVATTAELQITTQLQDVIRQMLHKHYERRRRGAALSVDEWKWDHESNEFATNYLGHILHYLEGMIVVTRDRQEEQP